MNANFKTNWKKVGLLFLDTVYLQQQQQQQQWKKRSEETQTLCASCSKAESKISPHRIAPSRGRGTAKI